MYFEKFIVGGKGRGGGGKGRVGVVSLGGEGKGFKIILLRFP